ncbi:sugar ABC transporter permease [Paenibacillus sp. MY03]|jgi:putative aldouronate transport system permease protein|uniref:Sugar ABC transporter permease n=1 Tax=Paenibacillus agaridevorans TaxID=171404 RepID=A0A2R5EX17_9BACL|nr:MULTISPECIES: carbohydrate ABC transporter permease [Paenibacillus]OUS73952.1 sugar ABC transporter permease [Paenibacillus sp. MY03]QNK59593.1 carbohydrate ABC transporter permease [Paenibacillus sp. PAMC21692]GBG11246.1 sugar ABC transporter permease [Paenibacillus agaridevorans]
MRVSLGEHIFRVCNTLFLSTLMIATMYPILYVAFASFSEPALMMAHKGILWKPLGFSFETYAAVFSNPMILLGYRNTLFIVIIGVALNLLLTSFAAYALSRKTLQYRKPLTLFIVFTMFFSGGLIPFYLLVRGLGITDTLWALILPTAISAFNLIIMRTSFEAVPDALEESAKIDGANDFGILFRIFLPLCKPVLAVVGLYYGVSHWNSWFNAMIFLQDRSLYPLQLILREILIIGEANSMAEGASQDEIIILGETLKYATIMVATLPVFLVYPFLQKYFVKGALIGAIKG